MTSSFKTVLATALLYALILFVTIGAEFARALLVRNLEKRDRSASLQSLQTRALTYNQNLHDQSSQVLRFDDQVITAALNSCALLASYNVLCYKLVRHAPSHVVEVALTEVAEGHVLLDHTPMEAVLTNGWKTVLCTAVLYAVILSITIFAEASRALLTKNLES